MTNFTEPSVDRAQAQLNALSEAARTITSELSLDRVLKRIAEIAANLVNARYAALGVPNEEGGMDQFHTFGMTDAQVERMDHFPLGRGLLGLLLTQPETLRLDDIRDDPRSVGFCEHHPPMTSFLGVPIISRGQHLGSLYLCDRRDGQPFSAEDERMVELLAAHAAVAIENARLSEQMLKLAIIGERDRISMELHDGIIQALYAVGIKLELTRLTLVEKPAVAEQIMSANQDLNRVIEDIRGYIRNLRTSANYSLTLHDQLEEIAEGFREVTSARLIMHVPRAITAVTEERVHAIVQITREALSNVVRHANATEVRLELRQTPAQLTLVIADNGMGFPVDQVSQGNGLRNIRQRARAANGEAEISSAPGAGTTLTVIFSL
jgi:signal transduction histidine kinase